ncbi:MAG: carboxymuconolactone decarboxylase family protein [Burkholderiales bacterium]
MPRISLLPEDAVAELQPAMARFKQILGFVPNSTLIMQRKPKVVAALGGLMAAVWGADSAVDAGFKRIVAFMASKGAGCQYCVAHQVSGALHLGVDEQKLQALWDYKTSPLYSEKERVALDFALAAGAVPNDVTDELFSEMRRYWTEDEIVEITSVIALFGFLNRFNDTMATPLEPEAIGDAQRILGKGRWSPGKHAP